MNERTLIHYEMEDQADFFLLSVCVVNVSENIFSQLSSLEMIQLLSCKKFHFSLNM